MSPQRMGGRPPRGQTPIKPRMSLRFEPVDVLMIREAARLFGQPATLWIRQTLAQQAMLVMSAAAAIPQGLEVGAKVFVVTHAPPQGAWAYSEDFEATGAERCWVIDTLFDCPPGISPDGRGCVITVVGGSRHRVTAYSNIRWLGVRPLAFKFWAAQAAFNAEKGWPRHRTEEASAPGAVTAPKDSHSAGTEEVAS